MRKVLVAESLGVEKPSIVDEVVNVEKGLELVSGMGDTLYLDSEAASNDFMKDSLIMVQLFDGETCVLIYCSTVDISVFKDELIKRTLVMHNAKNDLCFLYMNGIFPSKVWCTMVIEKLLSFNGHVQLGLEDLVEKYAEKTIDKSGRGRIIYELSNNSLEYCINDVIHLPTIYEKQKELVKTKSVELACLLENRFVLTLAYMEYCGVHLVKEKWEAVIDMNASKVSDAINELDEFVYREFPRDKKLCMIDTQGDLFEGFRDIKKCFVRWNSDQSLQALIAKCNDEQNTKLVELLKKYREVQGVAKNYGKVYINFISKDGRVHPKYKQLTSEGRVSCPQKGYSRQGYEIPMPSFMNLPVDSQYRSSIEAEEGNVLICVDWSSHELCILAHISGDYEMLDAISNGLNLHDSMFSCLKGAIPEEEYNRLYEFRKQLNLMICYLGTGYGISSKFGCSIDTAEAILRAYIKTFPGLVKYASGRIANLSKRSYIPMNQTFGYRSLIQNIEKIRSIEKRFNRAFWKSYREYKQKFPNSQVVQETTWYKKEIAALERFAVQAPVSNTGAIMFKLACIYLYKDIRKNSLIGKLKMVIPQHDSLTIECPEEMADECKSMLTNAMERACEQVCPGLRINIKTWTGTVYR